MCGTQTQSGRVGEDYRVTRCTSQSAVPRAPVYVSTVPDGYFCWALGRSSDIPVSVIRPAYTWRGAAVLFSPCVPRVKLRTSCVWVRTASACGNVLFGLVRGCTNRTGAARGQLETTQNRYEDGGHRSGKGLATLRRFSMCFVGRRLALAGHGEVSGSPVSMEICPTDTEYFP